MFNEICDELCIYIYSPYGNVSNYSLLKYVLLNNYILLSYEERREDIILLDRRGMFLLDIFWYTSLVKNMLITRSSISINLIFDYFHRQAKRLQILWINRIIISSIRFKNIDFLQEISIEEKKETEINVDFSNKWFFYSEEKGRKRKGITKQFEYRFIYRRPIVDN